MDAINEAFRNHEEELGVPVYDADLSVLSERNREILRLRFEETHISLYSLLQNITEAAWWALLGVGITWFDCYGLIVIDFLPGFLYYGFGRESKRSKRQQEEQENYFLFKTISRERSRI